MYMKSDLKIIPKMARIFLTLKGRQMVVENAVGFQ